MNSLVRILLLYCVSVSLIFAAPLDLLGVAPGSTHRISLGGGEINVRVVEAGKEGWVLFTVLSDDSRWRQGTRLWINLDRVDNISAPTTAAVSAPSRRPASANEVDIANLPCFPQADAREAMAAAKSETFDKNKFLTECILSQRKKP